MDGREVYDVRKKLGQALAREQPADADVVIPVPDSGRANALGYAQESGIPYEEGLMKNRYVERTFILPEQSKREEGGSLTLKTIRSTILGKRVVVVDDSIVRGTTLRKIVQMLRRAGQGGPRTHRLPAGHRALLLRHRYEDQGPFRRRGQDVRGDRGAAGRGQRRLHVHQGTAVLAGPFRAGPLHGLPDRGVPDCVPGEKTRFRRPSSEGSIFISASMRTIAHATFTSSTMRSIMRSIGHGESLPSGSGQQTLITLISLPCCTGQVDQLEDRYLGMVEAGGSNPPVHF